MRELFSFRIRQKVFLGWVSRVALDMKITRLDKTKRIYQPSFTPQLNWNINLSPKLLFALAIQNSHITSRIGINESTLDLGSNLGFVALHVARQFPNNFVLGIEPDTDLAEAANRSAEKTGMSNAVFQSLEINPQNIAALPNFDNVIFLSVFHQWVRSFGFDESSKMLDILCEKTQKRMFFSMATTSGSPKNKNYLPDMGETMEDSEDWIRQNVLGRPGFEIRMLDRIETTYESSMPRSLFLLSRI